MAEHGIVYILVNPAMPGLVKIGQTTKEIDERMKELYKSGVPLPFECLYACEVDDCELVETSLHKAFYPHRINPQREFFEIDPEQAISILKLFQKKDITPKINEEINSTISTFEKEASEKYKKRRPPINFIEMGIPIGSKISFVYGDITDEAVISSDRKVKYKDKNEEISLTQLTREILDIDYNIQPTKYWEYNGKSLHTYYEDTYTYIE